jgi:hypothetical protein
MPTNARQVTRLRRLRRRFFGHLGGSENLWTFLSDGHLKRLPAGELD